MVATPASPPRHTDSIVFARQAKCRQSAVPFNTQSFAPTRVCLPDGISIGSSVFVVLTDMPNRQAHLQSMHATPRRLQQKHASRWCDAAFNAPCVRRSLHVYDDNSQTQHCTHILALILLFLRELIQHCIWHTVGLLHLSYETFLSAQMTTTSTSDAVIPVSCKILLKTISTT